MRIFVLLIAALAISGCARTSSGYSFHQVVLEASEGLKDYETWVHNENNQPEDLNFPDALCLAGVHFTAALAETKSRSGNVGLPLAAPSVGLTGMLGYQFISTESDGGNVAASLMAQYPRRRAWSPSESEKVRNAKRAEFHKEQSRFVATVPTLRDEWKGVDRETGTINPPEHPTANASVDFEKRDDLGAELWRIRQTIHGAFLNSPVSYDTDGNRSGYFLAPGPVTFSLGYTMTGGQGAGAKLSLAGRASGSATLGQGTSESNRMVLVYFPNQSIDPMNCDHTSFGDMTDKETRKEFNQAFSAAVTQATKAGSTFPLAVVPSLN